MSSTTWFEALTGFQEESPEQVRANLQIDGPTLTSSVNGRTMRWGRFEVPTLGELRRRTAERTAMNASLDALTVQEVVGDVQALHADPAHANSLFQVASQFNLLEMISPSRTPEAGVGIYQYDRTQGPACAIAAGAGTIYRNYFVPVDGRPGQTQHRQINTFRSIEERLRSSGAEAWPYRNGYVLPTRDQLTRANEALATMAADERDALRASLQVGVQWETEVTLPGAGHLVSQIYCSALPIAYSSQPASLWSNVATLVLESAYEATLHAAILNYDRTGIPTVFLTLLGGGAFGNERDWIFGALRRALSSFSNTALDVRIVSYGASDRRVRSLVKSL